MLMQGEIYTIYKQRAGSGKESEGRGCAVAGLELTEDRHPDEASLVGGDNEDVSCDIFVAEEEMAQDPNVKDFIAYLKKNPKYQEGGKMEDGFYMQPDGSFFDEGGYYFNPQGYDEFGGYYDDDGNYCEEYEGGDDGGYDPYEDYHGHGNEDDTDSLTILIDAHPQSTLTATLKNLPFKAWEKDIDEQLKAKNVTFTKVDYVYDKQSRLQQATVHLPNKEAAKCLLKLNRKPFLGRDLRISFPELENEDEVLVDFAATSAAPPPAEAKVPQVPQVPPSSVPVEAPKAPQPVSQRPAAPPPPAAIPQAPAETKKVAQPAPAEERKAKPQESNAVAPKPVAKAPEYTPPTKPASQMSPEELAKHLAVTQSDASRKPSASVRSTGKPTKRPTGNPQKQAVKQHTGSRLHK